MNKRMRFEWPLTVRLREGRTNGTDLRWAVSPVHIEAADEIDRLNEINADLLEVARKFRSAMSAAFNAGTEEREGGSVNRQAKHQAQCEKVLAECRAAIAKAEGKE